MEVTVTGISIDIPASEPDFNTGICLYAGVKYYFNATGTWTDLSITTNADGFEKWYMSPFKVFRRHRQYHWFALIGKVDFEEPFLIGSTTEYTPPVTGDLICYANDVAGFYKNNKGAVKLTIKKGLVTAFN